MKSFTLLLAGCQLLSLPALADDGPGRFSRAIETAPRRQEEILAVELDPEVYQHALPSLADLRVYDREGREVGYILRRVPATETTVVRKTGTLRASQLTLKPREDRGLEITLAFDANDPPPDGLRLVTPLKNFEQHVEVLGSDDGENWEPLAGGLLFDYARYMDVRSDTIPLPRTSHERLKIIVDDVTAEQESELMELTRHLRGDGESQSSERVLVDRRPFRIDRVEFWTEQAEQQVQTVKLTDYQPVPLETSEDKEHKRTQLIFTTESQPITSLQIKTSDRNFNRRVTVERETSSGASARWLTIDTDEISRLDFHSLQREQLVIEIPETRSARYRLLIDNRDSLPLMIEQVEVRGPVQEVLFLAAADGDYSLGYGGELSPPSYDTAALTAALKETKTTFSATLSKSATPLTLPPPNAFNNPWLLSTIILLLIGALAWALFQAARRVDQLGDSDGNDPKEPRS